MFDEDARKLIYKEHKRRMYKQRLVSGMVGASIAIFLAWVIEFLWKVV